MRTIYAVLLTAAVLGALRAQEPQPVMVGMPDYGVTLSGSPANPVIVNHSGKAVIAYDVETMDANGRRSGIGQIMAPSVLPAGIPDGGSAYAMGAAPVNPTVPMASAAVNAALGPIVRATLLSVIFADGQFVGTDKFGTFERFGKELKAAKEAGILAKAGAWDQLDALAQAFRQIPRQTPPPEEDPGLYTFRQLAASRLVETWRLKGDAAASQLAEIYSSLPTPWK